MNHVATVALAGLLLGAGALSAQQPLDLAKVVEALDRDGRVALDHGKVLALKYDYTFGGDAGSYGFLSSALGVGSVLGGLLVARSGRATHRRLGSAALFLGVAIPTVLFTLWGVMEVASIPVSR